MYTTPNPIARLQFMDCPSDMAQMQAERARMEAELDADLGAFETQLEDEEIGQCARELRQVA